MKRPFASRSCVLFCFADALCAFALAFAFAALGLTSEAADLSFFMKRPLASRGCVLADVSALDAPLVLPDAAGWLVVCVALWAEARAGTTIRIAVAVRREAYSSWRETSLVLPVLPRPP